MSDSPRQWWQWVLMYPTIIIALFAGLPQIYQWASRVALGLSPFANVDAAKAQEEAWQRNVDCLHGIDHVKPSSSTNYAIDLVSCPSGDILVTLTPLQKTEPADFPMDRDPGSVYPGSWSFFVQPALAQSPQPSAVTPERMIDIKKQGATIIRRVQLSSGACVDETIDAYTGRRSSQKPAPCGKF